MSIKSRLKRLYQKKIKKMSDSEILIDHLRRIGTRVGNNCYIFSNKFETTESYLTSTGNVDEYKKMSNAGNLYGDGLISQRIRIR